MRIIFWGTPDPAVPALRALLEASDVEVVAVVTNPDRPSGRGYKLTPPPVKVLAAEHDVEVLQPDKPRELLEVLADLRPDACAVVAYGALLPSDVLAAGGRGFVNLHFSLLPAWRGAAPVQHSLLAGDPVTGVTCFVLDEGMDTGPVLNRLETPIEPDETAGELMARLADLGAPLLVDALRGLVSGELEPEPQPAEGASLAPKIRPEDARLDWHADAEDIARAVRAFNPVPGAHTTFRGQRLKVHRARTVTDAGAADAPPGTVAGSDEVGPVVACGTGAVALTEVQPAGKPRMDGPAFANGYRPVGERLGADVHPTDQSG